MQYDDSVEGMVVVFRNRRGIRHVMNTKAEKGADG